MPILGVQAIQQGSLWTIINDVVYDLTEYIQEHPGGVKAMEEIVGEIDLFFYRFLDLDFSNLYRSGRHRCVPRDTC